MKHPLTTNEASDGARPRRSAAANGRLVSPVPDRRLSLLGSLGWAAAAPKPHATSTGGDTAIELVSDVITWPVLVLLGRLRETNNWACDGLIFFETPWAVYSVQGAIGPRAAAIPVALHLEFYGSRF